MGLWEFFADRRMTKQNARNRSVVAVLQFNYFQVTFQLTTELCVAETI